MSEQLELNDFQRCNSVKKLYCPNAVSYTVLAMKSEKIILILCETHQSIGYSDDLISNTLIVFIKLNLLH
ncbi:hypothetical protein [Clostridium folliculivorans]|uniref:Uncharacterized protein n=1 Tax=Clostridium folliculivorans TaxID=2886038 RepID=A0A9W5Y3Z4_9CLOT|nr:hypothetical protein [Clostridium folliculivorans]GKU26216.1 hypothetical protein CFOLD11_30430 [Clostridium folliculivorans]GKU31888.1 hypothetical protein CFB3_39960 [Clostridium folliculivorans]